MVITISWFRIGLVGKDSLLVTAQQDELGRDGQLRGIGQSVDRARLGADSSVNKSRSKESMVCVLATCISPSLGRHWHGGTARKGKVEIRPVWTVVFSLRRATSP